MCNFFRKSQSSKYRWMRFGYPDPYPVPIWKQFLDIRSGCQLTILPDIQPANRIVIISATLLQKRAVFPAFSSREVTLGQISKIGIHSIIYPHCDVTFRKLKTKKFFKLQLKTWWIRRGFEQLSSSIGWRIMALQTFQKLEKKWCTRDWHRDQRLPESLFQTQTPLLFANFCNPGTDPGPAIFQIW